MINAHIEAIYPWAIPTSAQTADLLELATGAIRRFLDGSHVSMPPQLIVLSRRNADEAPQCMVFACGCGFNEPHEKRMFLRIVAQNLAAARRVPMAVALASEMWLSPDTENVQPRDHPERQEVLGVMLQPLSGKGIRVHIPVQRDRKERMLAGGAESRNGEDEAVTSPLLDAFLVMFAEEGLAACRRQRQGQRATEGAESAN